ncbi:unnamed protein product [Urochloa decumbens]|uniref:F-box domain-containing protein n=1 Tax=Urochloa decumbens TaxID=240449 RepID=A0ABC9F502_9POAL
MSGSIAWWRSGSGVDPVEEAYTQNLETSRLKLEQELTMDKHQQEVDHEDRLSKLPDDALILILNRLDMKEAVRSSTLSRRWRHIPSVLPIIVLDVESFKPNHDDGFKPTVSDTAWSNMALAHAARSVLAHKSHRPIRNLAVTLYLRAESMAIVRAVDTAMSPGRGRGVVAAKLKFLGEKMDYLCDHSDKARNGKRFLSCFNACPRAFAGLTGLHVESVRLGESDIYNVLRACRKLKRLSLTNCDCGRGTVLAHEHPELTKLKLNICGPVELKWLPKLAQVKCWCWVPSQSNDGYPLLFGHVPRLRQLLLFNVGYLGYPTLLPSKLLDNCSTLRELFLNFGSERIWIQPEGPELLAPLLQNLMILNLENIYEECDLTWTLFLLQAAPRLKMLQIKVSNHQCVPIQDEMVRQHFICAKGNIEWKVPDFKHHNLILLDILGFQPDSKFMGYIRRVMRAAVNLEVISLNDQLCECCGFCPTTRYPRTNKERDLIRKEIHEGITSPVKDVQFHEMSLEGPVKIID